MSTHLELLDKICSKNAVVGIIGLGYVGLPLAATTARNGYSVIGFDVDPGKISRLERGDSYIDAVPADRLREVLGHMRFTADFAEISACDVVIICVPTPLTAQREPDLSYIEATASSISERLRPGTLIVLESTTFPGTTSEVLSPLLAQDNALVVNRDYWVAFSPEREDPGNKSFHTATIPKVVGADNDAARDLVQAFYERVVEKVVPVSSAATAEAVKITENIFRAVNIALVNELKLIYEALDIDVWEVIDAAATKPFGFMPFYPGPGLGGHCIPIDPFYLTWKAREYGLSTRFIELAGEINVMMPAHVLNRLRDLIDREHGIGLSAARILLVGAAYKKNVSDVRESPAIRLLDLMEKAGASVDFLDPLVTEIPRMREYPHLVGRKPVAASDLASGDYHAVLIATDHDAIDYAALIALGVPILDTRNTIHKRGLDTDRVTKA